MYDRKTGQLSRGTTDVTVRVLLRRKVPVSMDIAAAALVTPTTGRVPVGATSSTVYTVQRLFYKKDINEVYLKIGLLIFILVSAFSEMFKNQAKH